MLLDIIDNLITWDKKLFTYINGKWINSFFDTILPFLRESIFWAPLYLFLLILALQNFGKAKWYWIGGFLLTFALTDSITSRFIKNVFQRVRPCNDPLMADHVRLLLKYCGSGYSFVSTHAANHFAIAMFVFLTCKTYHKWFVLFFVWAFAIAYSQVYVGVHYPLDVFGGACVGLFLGWMTASLYKYFVYKSTTASSPYN